MNDMIHHPLGYDSAAPSEELEEGVTVRLGEPLESGTRTASVESVIDALKTVYDPEIPVDIYELGLIYDIDIHEDGSAKIEMTLTTPGCPVAGEMPGMVARAATSVPGIGEVLVTLTWDPPWSMDMMSDDARFALDMF